MSVGQSLTRAPCIFAHLTFHRASLRTPGDPKSTTNATEDSFKTLFVGRLVCVPECVVVYLQCS